MLFSDITIELKDTHLGGFGKSSQSSGRAPLTSTIKTDGSGQTLVEEKPSFSSSNNSNGIAASEAMVSPPPKFTKPGILICTLHEGKGFSLPQHIQQQYAQSTMQNSVSNSSGFSVAGSMRDQRAPGGMAGSYAAGRPQSMGINAAPTVHGRYSTRYLPYVLLDFDKVQVFVDAVSGTPENPYWAGENTQYKFDVSRATEISVTLYLRNPNARPGAGRSEDIFLGYCKIHPRFDEPKPYVGDPKESKKDREKNMAAFTEHERQLGQSGIEWLDMKFGTGSIKIGVTFVENRQRTLKIEDFELLKVVGKGSFGKVMQVM